MYSNEIEIIQPMFDLQQQLQSDTLLCSKQNKDHNVKESSIKKSGIKSHRSSGINQRRVPLQSYHLYKSNHPQFMSWASSPDATSVTINCSNCLLSQSHVQEKGDFQLDERSIIVWTRGFRATENISLILQTVISTFREAFISNIIHWII